jgi:hypothetical protein
MARNFFLLSAETALWLMKLVLGKGEYDPPMRATISHLFFGLLIVQKAIYAQPTAPATLPVALPIPPKQLASVKAHSPQGWACLLRRSAGEKQGHYGREGGSHRVASVLGRYLFGMINHNYFE